MIGPFEQKYSNTWQTSSFPHLLLSHVWTLPRRGKNSNGKMCTDVLATAVITVKTWKQSKCLTGKWLSKQWDYYIAIKNDRGENCQHGELCTGRNWQEHEVEKEHGLAFRDVCAVVKLRGRPGKKWQWLQFRVLRCSDPVRFHPCMTRIVESSQNPPTSKYCAEGRVAAQVCNQSV